MRGRIAKPSQFNVAGSGNILEVLQNVAEFSSVMLLLNLILRQKIIRFAAILALLMARVALRDFL